MDLEPGTVIAQTKQVNDVNRIENRQSNFTNTFSLPKTAGNVKALGFMAVTGNGSNVPYAKNECSLFSDTGECFVHKGWAVVKDGGDSYNVAIVDGIIDFFKKIEGKNLSDLHLDALTHSKTAAAIMDTWGNSLPYKYILADYNGNTGNTNTVDTIPEVNIDYLIPSVNVAWLWRKIWEEYNDEIQPTGSVFDMFDFKELWMTFPKGQVRDEDNDSLRFKSEDYNFIQSSNVFGLKMYYCRFMSTVLYENVTDIGRIHLKVLESASYKLKIKGRLFGHENANAGVGRDSQIRVCKNSNGLDARDALNNRIDAFGDQMNVIPYSEDFDYTSEPFQLDRYDTISLVLTGSNNGDTYEISEAFPADLLEVELYRVEPVIQDFGKAFTDFSIKDFLNEVVHRFGLTMFKDKYTNKYEFLTLQEQLQTSQVVDWSNKFNKKNSEDYLYGSYAQNNWFRYNYNDKESTHSDYYIGVENVNLPETRDVIKSKIYSPERLQVTYLNQSTNVYKLWDKDFNDNPNEGEDPVSYKELDKRYYFLRSFGVLGGVNLVSQYLNGGSAVYSYRESYNGLTFEEIITKYYSPLQRVLEKTIIVNAEIWLTDTDIVNFDFKKLYYIEQLSNYFIVNKINNYVSGNPTKVELIRVKFTEPVLPILRITDLIMITANNLRIYFINEYEGTAYIQRWEDVEWIELGPLPATGFITYNVEAGTYIYRLRYNDVYSDFEQIIVT